MLLSKCPVEIKHHLPSQKCILFHPVIGRIGRTAGKDSRSRIGIRSTVVLHLIICHVIGKTVAVAYLASEYRTGLETFKNLVLGCKSTAYIIVIELVPAAGLETGNRRAAISAVLVVISCIYSRSFILEPVEIVGRITDKVGKQEA